MKTINEKWNLKSRERLNELGLCEGLDLRCAAGFIQLKRTQVENISIHSRTK